MFGWESRAASRASLRKRSRKPACAARYGGSSVSPPGRSRATSRARNTMPIPPRPSSRSRVYLPATAVCSSTNSREYPWSDMPKASPATSPRHPVPPPTAVTRGCRRERRDGLLHDPDAVHEVAGLPEAARGHSPVLPVEHHHPPPQREVELARRGPVAHREFPDRRRDPRHRGHRELSLPRLAEPALLRKLLQKAGPLSLRVAPGEGRCGERGEQHDRRQEGGGENPLPVTPPSAWRRRPLADGGVTGRG